MYCTHRLAPGPNFRPMTICPRAPVPEPFPFVPALVMKELENGDALQLPSSQQYEAVALFAVRCLPSPSTWGFAALLWALIPWRLPHWPGRISRASRT